jgi:hypothetical protein
MINSGVIIVVSCERNNNNKQTWLVFRRSVQEMAQTVFMLI